MNLACLDLKSTYQRVENISWVAEEEVGREVVDRDARLQAVKLECQWADGALSQVTFRQVVIRKYRSEYQECQKIP